MQCKILLCVLFVGLVGVWASDDNDNNQDSSKSGSSSGSQESGSDNNSDNHSGSGDDSKSSEEDQKYFYYPCEKNPDKKCVQEYFLSTGPFRPANHEDGQSMYLKEQVTYIPIVNAEVKCVDVQITFPSTKIEKLYVNKKTNTLVITVMFVNGITIESPCTDLISHRNGYESVHATDYAKFTYPPMNITCEVPWSNKHISMKDARISAFISEKDPKFELGPKISDSQNQVTRTTYKNFINNIHIAIRELFVTKSYYCMHAYLQHYIAGYTYQFSGDLTKCH